MNKTVYKASQNRKRELQTQTNFRSRTPISPFHRQKSMEEGNLRADNGKIEASLPKHYRMMFVSSAVSASNWCLYDSKARNFVGLRENHQREVASLTKIMTTIVGLELF